MNNERIKEIALHAGFKLKEQPGGGMDLNPYVYTFARHLLAERAVSPAESVNPTRNWLVQQILLFRGNNVPQDVAAAHRCAKTIAARYETQITKAREEGYAAGRRNGARDERIASKAEAEEAAALAAQQAPWSRVAESQTVTLNYSFAADVLGALFNGGRINPEAFERTRQAFAAIMRGEKVFRNDGREPDWQAYAQAEAAAQPLQQAGGKEVLANGWPKDFHEVVKGAEDAAHRQGRAAAVEEAIRTCESIAQDHRDQYKGRGKYAADNPRRADPHADGCFDGASECADAIRAISSQPSDNLQQASTAQAEPAPVGCPDLGDAEEFAEMLAGHGGMLAQAIEMVDGCMDETMVEPEDAAAWQIVKKHIRPAQATPEGADLPPLPYTTYNGYSDGSEPLYTADQMREYARHFNAVCNAAAIKEIFELKNALAATTAAEPVYQMASRCGQVWTDMDKYAFDVWLRGGGNPARVRTLYRAVPPQQVDTSGLPG